MVNHHSFIHLIISLTLTLLLRSFNTLSVNLTLGILLCPSAIPIGIV